MLQLKWYGNANNCTYPLLFLAQRSLHTAVLLQQVYDIYSASVVRCCGVISPIRHTYEEPISFIPHAENKSSVKPKEIKVKLHQDPTDQNSDKVQKIFTKFVENTPEAYCQWMCNMEEYIRGKRVYRDTSRNNYGQPTIIELVPLHYVRQLHHDNCHWTSHYGASGQEPLQGL
jgi:hypothetical protein